MRSSSISHQTSLAKYSLQQLSIACDIKRGAFTVADAERLIGGVLADQLDHYRLSGVKVTSKRLTPGLLARARTSPAKVPLAMLLTNVKKLDLTDCLEQPLSDLKQANGLESPLELRRWKAKSAASVRQLLKVVQTGHERLADDDWSEAGAYFVARHAMSGLPLIALATELQMSPLVLSRRELDEYRDEGPCFLKKLKAAFAAIDHRTTARSAN